MEVNNRLKLMRNPTMNLDKNYSYYLYDPELKKRHLKALPNDIMYRYFPNENDILIKNKNPKDNYRFIFNGMDKTPYEKEKLEELTKYITEKEKDINNFFPEWWLESDTLRFLQATNYDIKKTHTLIKENIKYSKQTIKIIDKRIRFILNYGFIYMYGRDMHFRPVIIVEVNKSCELMDKLKYTFEELNQAMIFFVNYIINFILLPGQIENWIMICDLKSVGVGKLGQFKSILNTLNRFRGRVFRNYILNLGTFMRAAASGVLSILGSSSAKKIIMVENGKYEVMQQYIRKENLQIKYGGSAPNVIYGEDNLFPPIVPSDIYINENENLNIVSPETYKEMCLEAKPFKPFIVSEAYNKMWEKEEEQKKKRSKMRKSISIRGLSVKDFINQFENKNIKKILNNKNIFHKKYKPKKIDVNNIKSFFNEMRNKDNEQ